MATQDLEHLLGILYERDIPLGRDGVAKAFQFPQSSQSTQDWMHEYLLSATLLTKEESDFHSRIGEANQRSNAKQPTRRICTDAEFEIAIASLEKSTAAIDKQCALLEAQKQALSELKARNSSQLPPSPPKDQRKQKHAREKAQTELEIDQLSASLQTSLRASSKHAEATIAGLPISVARVLEKDDRLLDGLQKLVHRLQDDSTSSDSVDELEKLCRTFSSLESMAIRSRVDAAYQRGLHEVSQQPNGFHDTDPRISDERDTLRSELEELCSEIDGLVAMVTEHQYRLPISRSLNDPHTHAEAEKTQWSAYLADTLRYLTARLEVLDNHQHQVHASQSALSAVSAALDEVLNNQPEGARNKQSQASSAPPKPKTAQKGLKPLRLVQANLFLDSSVSADVVAQLLRQLDVRNVDPSDTIKLAQVLDETLNERRRKVRSLERTIARDSAEQRSLSLTRSEIDVGDLLEEVYKYSEFGRVKLVDGRMHDDVQELESKTQVLGDSMRQLDLDAFAKEIKIKQRIFLE